MDNPKINKVSDDIEKIKAKITELQGKLRKLEQQKTMLENDQIVALVRSNKISDAELGELMRSIRNGVSTTASAQIETEMEDSIDEETAYG
jgi:hypothetical protein